MSRIEVYAIRSRRQISFVRFIKACIERGESFIGILFQTPAYKFRIRAIGVHRESILERLNGPEEFAESIAKEHALFASIQIQSKHDRLEVAHRMQRRIRFESVCSIEIQFCKLFTLFIENFDIEILVLVVRFPLERNRI